jgi:hypothetical protein
VAGAETAGAGRVEAALTRRSFLGRAGGGLLAALGGTLGYGAGVEPFRCEETEVEVPIEGLPRAFDGFRIAHVTDIHHGPIIDIEAMRSALSRIAARRPDLVAMTGDFTAGADYSEAAAEAVGDLGAAAPHGVVWVPGNHDYWGCLPTLRRVLGRKGAVELTNRATLVRRGSDRIALAGIDDHWEGAPDPRGALGGVDPALRSVVLAHNPDALHGGLGHAPLIDHAPALVLAGHTHGGQVVIPGLGPLTPSIRRTRYVSGLFREGRTAMYVSRGVGLWIGVRINCPPEIAYLTLRAV